ncbi:MAG: outer membrane beta-barrel protein [Rhodospirillales bacterium]
MTIRFFGVGVSVLAALVLVGEQAAAQVETVRNRPRPELAPLGVRAGSFLVFPQMSVQQEYNDNVFATRKDEEDDFVTSLRPGLSIESDWSNHALNFSTGADFGFYADKNSQNYRDWNASLDGRLDVTRDIQLFGGGGVARLHEERGSPDDVGTKEPVKYHLFSGFASYVHTLDRLNFTLTPEFRRHDFDDAQRFTGPSSNEDDRDRNELTASFRTGYEITPSYEAFLRLGGNRRKYDQTPDDNGFDRDSWGYEAVLGAAFDLTGVTAGDIFAGYQKQRLNDDSNLDNIDGPTFGASLEWSPTTLTTIGARVVRNIETTTVNRASGLWGTLGEISVDHELLRNLLLNGTFSAAQNDYQGISREDWVYTAGFGARYMMNRNFHFNLGYRFRSRNSTNQPGSGANDYIENRVRISLQAQL